VFAEVSCVGTSGVACFQAEGITAHEVVPFDDLRVRVCVSAEGVGVEETAHRVSAEISTVRIHLSSVVCRVDVHLCLVYEADDLDVVRCLHKLDTLQRALRDETCAMSRLSAPRNHLALRVSDEPIGIRRAPKTEVIKRIKERSLAVGVLVLGRGVADVETELLTAN